MNNRERAQAPCQTRNNTRKQLIELSADLLCQRGFSGFSYQDLANGLGIRKASVHHHFTQKADLGLALCDWTEHWLLQGFKHFDDQSDNAADKLQYYLRAAAKHTFNEHKQCPVSALHNDLALLPESMRTRLTELIEIELDWVSGVFEQGLHSGELISATHSDPRKIARLFIFACKGALFYARLQGPQYFNQSMDMLLQQWLPATRSRSSDKTNDTASNSNTPSTGTFHEQD